MTENEAIEVLNVFNEKRKEFVKERISTRPDYFDEKTYRNFTKSIEMSVKALEEIQQYRSIGTVEEIESLNFSSNQLRLANLAESYKEKLKEYEEIGTVSECRKAMEKQEAKRPEIWGDGCKAFLKKELESIKGLAYIVDIPISEFQSIEELTLFVKMAKQNKCGAVLCHETSNFHQGVVIQLFDKEYCNVKDSLDI